MIKNIKIENFCTIQSCDVDLNSNRVMIVGGSGSGKSSLLGAIFACMYGSFPDKPESSLYEDVLDPSKFAKMSILFSVDGNDYIIERIVFADQNKTEARVIERSSGKMAAGPQLKGVAAWVDENIAPKNAFLSLYFLSQKSKNDLCEIVPSEGSKVLLDLLGITNFQKLSKKFFDLVKVIDDETNAMSTQLSNIATAKESIKSLKKNKKDLLKKVEEIESEISDIDSFLHQTSGQVTSPKISKRQQRISEIDSKIINLNSERVQQVNAKTMSSDHLSNIATVPCKDDSDAFMFPSCPFLNAESVTDTYKKSQAEIQRIDGEIKKLTDEKSELTKEIQEIEEEGIVDIDSKRVLSMGDKTTLSNLLKNANQEVGSTEARIEELEILISKESHYSNVIANNKKKREHTEFIANAFSRQGAPSIIISEALPELNKIANDICNQYNLKFTFSMEAEKARKDGSKVDTLNIMIIDGSGKKRHVLSYSGGERQLMQIVLRFAVQEYISATFGNVGFDMFFGDEIWSEMDSNMVNVCFEIIKDRGNFDQVIIVSHDHSLTSKFNMVLEASRPSGWTVFNNI